MLAQLEEDFSRSSDSIRQALNEMGDKVDNLEQSVYGLVVDAGLDEEDESPHSEIVIIPDVDDDNNKAVHSRSLTASPTLHTKNGNSVQL